MKRILLSFIAALCMVASVMAQPLAAKRNLNLSSLTQLTTNSHQAAKALGAPTTKAAALTDPEVTLNNRVFAYYDGSQSVGDYYFVLAENEDAAFDSGTGKVVAVSQHVVFLDMYAAKTSGEFVLADGTYTPANGTMKEGTFDENYSGLIYYDENGEQYAGAPLSSIDVKRSDDGTYNITMHTAPSVGKTMYYTGKVVFVNANGGATVYPQIGDDVETTCTGGMAFYHGNLYQSNTGNLYVNLFDCDFEKSNGAMKGLGYNISICLFNKLFGNPKSATVTPGTYTVARNFEKNTFFPGMEIDYMGMTIPFGSFVKQRVSMTDTDGDYKFAYITDGTITITQNEDGTFNFDIDCTTADGYNVVATAKNIEVPVTDVSDDKQAVHVSNLTDDVKLDLNYIKKARAYYTGVTNDCNVFVLDIGSPSGKDGTEGDIMRLEFVTDKSEQTIPTGNYSLMTENHLYTNLYAPYKMVQGYFLGDTGDLSGTRYMHFEEGRYIILQYLAPIKSGTLSMEKVDPIDGVDQYHFVMDFIDDADFSISGEWTGPIELQYDPETVGINNVTTSTQGISFDGTTVRLQGVSATTAVKVYTTDGREVMSQMGAQAIDLSHYANGVYFIKADGQSTFKVLKK